MRPMARWWKPLHLQYYELVDDIYQEKSNDAQLLTQFTSPSNGLAHQRR